MNSIRMNEVAARVVAWHNRHPLARRITSAQVSAIGVIALPFVTTAERAGGTVRADLAAPRVVVEPSFGAPPVLDQMVTPDEPAPAPAAQDAAMAKASLRERAMAAVPGEVSAPGAPAALAEPEVAKAGGWLGALRLPWLRSRAGFESVFSENFIAPLRPRQVAAWALQHGSTTRPGEPAWPQREVLADAALQAKAAGKPGVEPVTLYLVTAAIDTPTRRLRVLLGRNGTVKVLGPRDWSLVRMLVVGLLLSALGGLAAWFLLLGAQAPGPEAALPAPPASAVAASASAASAASAPTLTQHVAEPAASAVVVIAEAVASAPVPQASAPVLAAAAEASASAAAIDKTRSSRTRPQLSDEARQAAMAEGKQMRASDPLPPARTPPPAASAPAPKPSKAPDPGSLAIPATPEADRGPSGAAQRPAQGGSAPATAKFYALVTKPSFSKVDAEARMILLRAGAANAIAPAGTRIELIQARQAWQAVWWPFAKRDDAERARALLAVRGVQVELVEF
ncbi:MAG: hypothetical protein IV092_24155 [Burkholderiaceae bacterium]|nr:hypothetical protein [Burkholderiaceae bacterium]